MQVQVGAAVGEGGTKNQPGRALAPATKSLPTPTPGRYQDYEVSLTVRVKDVDEHQLARLAELGALGSLGLEAQGVRFEVNLATSARPVVAAPTGAQPPPAAEPSMLQYSRRDEVT